MSELPSFSIQPDVQLNEFMPPCIAEELEDLYRLCPILAGVGLLQGNLLVVRHGADEVEITAPRKLLSQVLKLCDGTLGIRQILDKLPSAFDRQEFLDFLKFLLGQGALMDANLVTVNAARYGFQESPFGSASGAAITDRIGARFLPVREAAALVDREGIREVHAAPLLNFFENRTSTYTFAEADVSADSLTALLWSIAGVVSLDLREPARGTPKRTIASAGGMHLLKVFLVLQKQVGPYLPGVYRVVYPAARTVALKFMGSTHSMLPRAFIKPWQITYATGAIFLAADPNIAAMRYRNRALQYLFMEAGAALHNGGLSAPQLGLDFATIGGYYENIVVQMCELRSDLVLGGAIFGATPTTAQLEMSRRSPELEFAWVDRELKGFNVPFCLARAKVKVASGERDYAWGRDEDPMLASRKAAAEAIEREGLREPRSICLETSQSLPNAVDPACFVKYSAAQYARPNFPYARFDNRAKYFWAEGLDLVSGHSKRVLAELVFSRAALASYGNASGKPYSQATSSGCAAGTSQDDAVFRALLETIERDAFMRHWLAQSGGVIVARAALESAVRHRVEAIEATGCTVVIQHLDSEWAHVCMVSVQHEALHFTTMGTAAHFEFHEAVLGALGEAEARVYAWIHGAKVPDRRPSSVRTTEDHYELYGLKPYFKRADAVLFPKLTQQAKPLERMPFCTAEGLINRFRSAKLNPLMIDITPKDCFIDQGRTQLSVVKVLIPTLLPVSFGYYQEPLGMVSKAAPGSHFPHPFP
jgi:ribosomal protein S12 methylthiotransferase accessory factor